MENDRDDEGGWPGCMLLGGRSPPSSNIYSGNGAASAPVSNARFALQAASHWKNLLTIRGAHALFDLISEEVVLEAAVLYRPIVGKSKVMLVLEAANKIYERLEITHATGDSDRLYLEWTAAAFDGTEVGGLAVVNRSKDGAILHLAVHHRLLGAALQFSAELARHLENNSDIQKAFLAVDSRSEIDGG